MKKLLLLSILTMVFTMSSFAQDKTSDLKRLFELIDSEKMLDGMFSNMIPMMKQQAGEKIQGNNANEKLDEYINFMMAEMKSLTSKLINEELVGIYSQHFTHEEIKDLIKFYESPTGKKMIEKTPEVTTDLMNSMMKYMPEFQQRLTKKLEELK